MIGSQIRRMGRCASTNDEAARWAKDLDNPAPHGAVVVADAQTAGRGRQGRLWHSPAGENLYFSCILRPELPPHRVPPITLCAGIAVCEVVNSMGACASIKWPNDVLVGERKLAGILTEMSTQSKTVDSVILGVGLNVNARQFPKELAATSIALETGTTRELPEVLEALLASIHDWYQNYLDQGVKGLEGAFAEHSMLGGKPVRARVGNELICGTVISLGEGGGLVIEDARGQRHRVIAGEVELGS